MPHPLPISSPDVECCQPPTLIFSPRTACLRLLLFARPFSLQCPPWYAPIYLLAPGWFYPSQVPMYLYASLYSSLCVSWCLESSGSWSIFGGFVFAQGQGSRAPPLPSSRSPRPFSARYLAKYNDLRQHQHLKYKFRHYSSMPILLPSNGYIFPLYCTTLVLEPSSEKDVVE